MRFVLLGPIALKDLYLQILLRVPVELSGTVQGWIHQHALENAQADVFVTVGQPTLARDAVLQATYVHLGQGILQS